MHISTTKGRYSVSIQMVLILLREKEPPHILGTHMVCYYLSISFFRLNTRLFCNKCLCYEYGVSRFGDSFPPLVCNRDSHGTHRESGPY